jgi:hypothetical protein
MEALHRLHILKTQIPSARLSACDPDDLEQLSIHLWMGEQLNEATILTVSSEMVDLVEAAWPSLPEEAVSTVSIPWPLAFVVLGHPVRYGPPLPQNDPGCAFDPDPPVCALAWTTAAVTVPSLDGHFALIGPALGVTAPDQQSSVCVVEYGRLNKELEPIGIYTRPLVVDLAHHDAWSNTVSFMACLWIMVQQRIAISTRVQPDRHAGRRWEREFKADPPPIIEITLRRPSGSPPVDENGREVEWSHRWIVGGHWRNQYVPSTQDHRLTWIAPYVKGPDDKPLVLKDKVYSWTR